MVKSVEAWASESRDLPGGVSLRRVGFFLCFFCFVRGPCLRARRWRWPLGGGPGEMFWPCPDTSFGDLISPWFPSSLSLALRNPCSFPRLIGGNAKSRLGNRALLSALPRRCSRLSPGPPFGLCFRYRAPTPPSTLGISRCTEVAAGSNSSGTPPAYP